MVLLMVYTAILAWFYLIGEAHTSIHLDTHQYDTIFVHHTWYCFGVYTAWNTHMACLHTYTKYLSISILYTCQKLWKANLVLHIHLLLSCMIIAKLYQCVFCGKWMKPSPSTKLYKKSFVQTSKLHLIALTISKY